MNLSDRVKAARDQWHYRGQSRPDFAHVPQEGQESVWDFSRPPALRKHEGLIEVRVFFQGSERVIATSTRGIALCETAHPPSYYFHPDDVDKAFVKPTSGSSFCEWKGHANYYDVASVARAAWSYEKPFEEYEGLRSHIAFMPTHLMCFVNGERVRPQGGGFYGGWITSAFCGPFKGDPGIGG